MIDVMVPLEQEGTEAKILTWMVKVGEVVQLGDPLVELETDKVMVEVPAPVAGVLSEIVLNEGSEATPGAVLARIAEGGAVPDVATQAPVPASAKSTPTLADASRHSPAVRKALAETGLDPAGLSGTGRGGRLTRADVEAAAKDAHARSEPAVPTPAAQGRSRFVPHDAMRASIARNMLKSVTDAPQVTAVFEADFSAIMAHRAAHKVAFAQDGVALTYTAYIVAACAAAMQTVPVVNSRWHEDKLEIFHDINIGVGTALGDAGLVVPVIAQTQTLSLRGIAAKLQDLTTRARDKALTPADMRGGTFTISNHGVSGSLVAAPIIINQPQSAILGVGKVEKRVVVREVAGQDTIQIRPMSYVSLTIDHRVIDGHQTNSWLSAFVATLEGWGS